MARVAFLLFSWKLPWQFPIMRGIVRATKPYARANKIDKYSYLMWNSQAFVKALHKIGAKKCSDCFWPIVQYWLLIFVVELSEFPPTSTYKSLTLCIGKRRCRSIMDKGSLEVFLNADCWWCLLNCQCFSLFLSIGTYKCFAEVEFVHPVTAGGSVKFFPAV